MRGRVIYGVLLPHDWAIQPEGLWSSGKPPQRSQTSLMMIRGIGLMSFTGAWVSREEGGQV